MSNVNEITVPQIAAFVVHYTDEGIASRKLVGNYKVTCSHCLQCYSSASSINTSNYSQLNSFHQPMNAVEQQQLTAYILYSRKPILCDAMTHEQASFVVENCATVYPLVQFHAEQAFFVVVCLAVSE